MATNIPVNDDRYSQVVEQARAASKTPEEWLDETIEARIKRDAARSLFERVTSKNSSDMVRLGVKPSDVEREIADHRRGR